MKKETTKWPKEAPKGVYLLTLASGEKHIGWFDHLEPGGVPLFRNGEGESVRSVEFANGSKFRRLSVGDVQEG